MLLDVYVILAIAFPGASYCASFGLPLCVHPSRCLCAGILRDDSLNASFEVLYVCVYFGVFRYVHPSRCLVMCILRVDVLCAPFEVPCDVHPSRCCVLCVLRGALLCVSFEATLVRVLFFGKTSPPLPNKLLPGGSLCRKVSSLWWNFDRPFGYH